MNRSAEWTQERMRPWEPDVEQVSIAPPPARAPKPKRRWGWNVLMAVVALTALVALQGASTPTISIGVSVEGRAPTIVVTHPHATVASTLSKARLQGVDGHLLSAKTHTPIADHIFPAQVTLDGVPVERSGEVHQGQLLDVTNGQDQVEATVIKAGLPIAPPPLPRLEHYLWHPGSPGSQDAVVGAVSGEVVSATNVVPPSSPAAETGMVVALTFDDGPWAGTPQFVQLLQAKGVRATFCMVGKELVRRPDIARAVLAAGMTMCNHTLSHNEHLDRVPAAVVQAEVLGGLSPQVQILGKAPTLYRPPGGAISSLVEDVANRAGEQVIGWSVDPQDYTKPGPQAIIDRVMAQVRPGAIILMHDGGGDRSQTLAALGTVIDQLRAKGYSFTTPDALTPVPLGTLPAPASPAARGSPAPSPSAPSPSAPGPSAPVVPTARVTPRPTATP